MNMEQYFPTTSQAPAWQDTENPQFYAQFHTVYSSPDPKRHELGLVGGNNVSQIAGNMIDLESDLRGITRINTFAPWRKYQPPAENQTEITRTNWKNDVTIDTTPVHLPEYQMWAYPAIYAPKPMKNEACGMPQKY
jgi:hypothetical protein